ncbi:MAG: HAMP domain-containing sensor histidine kinase [Hungatella sp.]
MEEGNIDEDSRKALSETVESCKIAYEHLNKTHGLAKIQNLNIRVASFINIVNNVLQLREKELCDCRINVINESTVGQCLMDEFYMEKVVDNLIINAYESYQRKNKKEKYINITIKDNNGFVRLEIQDGGSGIDKQELDKVFEPFYSSKKSVTNWGVGLSYSYQIIKLHNGEIVAESELEKGSTFTVVLPAYYNIL